MRPIDRIYEVVTETGVPERKVASTIARLCGISPQAVYAWRRGDITDISADYIATIARRYKTSSDYLISGHENEISRKRDDRDAALAEFNDFAMKLNSSPIYAADLNALRQERKSGINEKRKEYMIPLSAWDDDTPLDDDEVARPCFTEVEASAGAGKTVVQENHGPKIRFSRRTLSKCGVLEDNAYGIKVSGNSMMPVLPHGATIGVDVGNKSIVDGEMYAIDHDGMLRVKMLYRVPGNQVRLASFNREEYKDETVSMNEVKVIGRVFWYSVLR